MVYILALGKEIAEHIKWVRERRCLTAIVALILARRLSMVPTGREKGILALDDLVIAPVDALNSRECRYEDFHPEAGGGRFNQLGTAVILDGGEEFQSEGDLLVYIGRPVIHDGIQENNRVTDRQYWRLVFQLVGAGLSPC